MAHPPGRAVLDTLAVDLRSLGEELRTAGSDRGAQLTGLSKLLGWTLSVEGNVAMLDAAVADCGCEATVRECHDQAQKVLYSLGACWQQLLRSELLWVDSAHAKQAQQDRVLTLLRTLQSSLRRMCRPYTFEYEPPLRTSGEPLASSTVGTCGKRIRGVPGAVADAAVHP